MNVLYLSPQFPPNFQRFVTALAAEGVSVLGIGHEPWHELSPEIQGALTEYCRVDSLETYDHVYRATAYLIGRHGRIDVVESHQEYWISLESRLRLDFNIPGRKPADTDCIKRKSAMKELLRSAGIPVAEGLLVTDAKAARAFIKQVGYPVVVKPDIGVGAAATYKLTSDEDLERFLSDDHGVDYFMEAFIPGELFSFDGMTDLEGTCVFYQVQRFSTGIMNVVTGGLDMHYYCLREAPAELVDLGLKTVKAFDIRGKFFHFEFFRRHDTGRHIALEVNIRPPGGVSTDMMNFANDIDVYRGWGEVIAHGRTDQRPSRAYHAAHVGRKNGMPYLHDDAAIREHCGDAIAAAEAIPPVFAEVLGDFTYIVRHPDEERLREMIQFIQAKTASPDSTDQAAL